MKDSERVGVFVCHCGQNIASTVDVEAVARSVRANRNVVHSETYKYICSEPGQNLIKDAVKKHNLSSFVVAACSPTLHEETFRLLAESIGINRYKSEIANIREQCSWVHPDISRATPKAARIVLGAVEKVVRNRPLEPIEVPLKRRCMVIGAGIAGINAALEIASSGTEVVLVERGPTIGGHMAQLSETFPTLDCAQCILTPRMADVAHNRNIKLLTNTEVIDVNGYVGNFRVKLLKKPRYVDISKCNLCAKCEEVCTVVVPNEFDCKLSLRRAIYLPFAQAVPASYVIDEKKCLGLNPLICGKCAEVCEPGAINSDQIPEIAEEHVGTIVVATGFNLYPKESIGEYGYGRYDDVIDSLQFERILSSSGPTKGEIRRPSDRKVPKSIVFVQCVGSRDTENGVPYCSRICCMYTAKHARLYMERVPDGKSYVFYIDVRAGGKGYEEFVQEVMKHGALYLRGKVSKIFKDGDEIVVWGADTLANRKVEIRTDMVVLAPAIVQNREIKEFSQKLRIGINEHGFFNEAHPKLRPVESLTAGIYLAGCAQSPKDITDSVAQAGGAASKVLSLFSKDRIYREPIIAEVDSELCGGCGTCVRICPYGAIEIKDNVSHVNDAVCQGCGACVSACPNGALQQQNLTDEQIFRMVDSALAEIK